MPPTFYKELKPIKHFLFEFFKSTNEFRTIGKATALFLISVSYLQIFFIYDALFIGGNITEGIDRYKALSIFDILSILIKFSMLTPLIEYDLTIFTSLYPLLLILTYIFSLLLLIAVVYISHCILVNREIYFGILLSIASSFFLFFQYTLFLPIELCLLYPFYSNIEIDYSPYNGIGFKIANAIFAVLFLLLSFIVALFNNESLNMSDNIISRKDCNVEVYMNIYKIIIAFTFIIKSSISQGYINTICIVSFLFFLYISLKMHRIYYSDFISEVVDGFAVAHFKVFISGLIAVIFGEYLHDYSFTIILTFFLSFMTSKYIIIKSKDVFIKKTINDVKDVDDLIYYTEVLQEEATKSVNGDPVAAAKIAGYILDHRNSCKMPSCPMKSVNSELFLPLINKSEAMNTMSIEKLYNNEIFLIHLLKEVFMILSSKFLGNTKFHFAYARFLLYRFGNIKLALMEIENSKAFEISLQQEFSFYILKHIANERLLNNQYYIANYTKNNISIVDILDVIVFDHLGKELEKEIVLCSIAKKTFWKLLKKKKIYIEDIYRYGSAYIQSKLSVDRIWAQLSLITTSNLRIHHLYAHYQQTICDTTPLEPPVQAASDDDDVDDIVESRFNDDIALMIIDSALSTEIGYVRYYNLTFMNIFSFGADELINKNVSLIMPSTIGKVHNDILIAFLETGKTKLIGNTTNTFIKLKNKLINSISMLLMPMPSFGDKNEVLGLMRKNTTNSMYVLFDSEGVIDSIDVNFNSFLASMNISSMCHSEEFDFFIFYIFPFLLSPIDHSHRPLFISESALMESGVSQICGYFDKELTDIITEVVSSMMNTRMSKKRRNAQIKIDYDKLTERDKRKHGVYAEFTKSLIKIKENIKRDDLLSNEDFNSKVNYIEQYNEYKSFVEESSDANNEFCSSEERKEMIVKKVFNCKISVLHFGKGNKMYIMELTIPPNDSVDVNTSTMINRSSSDKEEEDNAIRDEPKKIKTDNIIKENIDETGSISNKVKVSLSSIQTLIMTLRDEKTSTSSINISLYINIIFSLYFIALLTFIIFIAIYVNNFSNQIDIIVLGFAKYIGMEDSLITLRKLTLIEYASYTKSTTLPNINIYTVNTSLAENAAKLLVLSKEIVDILYKIHDNAYVNRIITMEFPDDKYTVATEVESALIRNNIYITDSSALKSEVFVDILSNQLSIDVSQANYDAISVADRVEKMEYIIAHTGSSMFDILYNKKNVLYELFNLMLKELRDIVKYFILSLGVSAFIVFVLVFVGLRKMFIRNMMITSKLTTINQTDIEEIVSTIDEFISQSTCFDINTEDKSITYDVDDENDKLLQDNNEQINKKEDSNEKLKRKTKIILSFVINTLFIAAILFIIFIVIYTTIDSYINTIDIYFTFTSIISTSKFYNSLILTVLRDVYLSENTLIFNSSHASNIEYINVLYETQKQSNLNMFTYFSQHEKTFEASLRNKMRDVFYSNVCVSSALNVNCTRGDVDISKVLVKGMKYAVDYYANQIDYVKIQYYTAIDDGTNLFIVFTMANDHFILCDIMNDVYLKRIYDYIGQMTKGMFNDKGNNVLLILIAVSVSCVIVLLITIATRWRRYMNRVKMEEAMSVKLIAEIPLRVIMKNNEILAFLKNYVVN